ncbi:hypothetical protein [Microbacterium aurantiacum]|uniref:Uncharacterized protein n=1 Tax=Microbacterium aurantiacum TaxID=162393 RepID=A0A0M8MRD2_9MICO|nr:hypothetical protein [Microbacterium chocolatum]ANG84643.1 hypothetical protein A8L33_03915 [Microbacterium chocolatum]KOS12240.1 hypothetical protein XI38_02370 [Microbacterium chocolatum]
MKYEPRSALSNPGGFGVLPGAIPPAADLTTSDLRYQGAVLQHAFARRVRLELVSAGKKVSSFVRDFEGDRNLDAARVRRVLRGATSATIEDFAFWGAQFPGVWRDLGLVPQQIADLDARRAASGVGPPPPRG